MSYPDSVNDQPSVITPDGDKYWYKNGQPHREDGPAVEWADGSKFWYKNGLRHREDGPAIERANGSKFWYLNGVQCTPDQLPQKKTCIAQELPKTNDTNEICYFCGNRTTLLFGRQMICSVCRK